MTENTQEARLQLGVNVGKRVNELIHDRMSPAEFLPTTGRSMIKEVQGKEVVWLCRGGHIETSKMFVSVFEVPRDTIGVAAFWDKDEIPDEDELVKLVEERLAEEYVKRYEAVEEILGLEPKVVVFGGIKTKEYLEVEPEKFDASEVNPGNWHFLVRLEIGIAGVK